MSEQLNIGEAVLVELAIDHDSPVPLHRQVEELFRDLIKRPEFQNGALLPREVDIAKRLGISRNTVRQATNKLVHEGLLDRKKGVGTTVSKFSYTSRLDNWFSFSREMEDKGLQSQDFSLSVLHVPASKEVAQALQIEEGREVVQLERLRGLEDGPFVFFISYFHPRIGITGNEDFSRRLYEIIETEYATVPSLSREEIKAMNCPAALAKKLKIKKGDAVLYRKRIVCDPGDRPIEYNLGYYRADRFAYSIDIRR